MELKYTILKKNAARGGVIEGIGRGAVVELERSVVEDIELHANNQLIAKGEVIVVDGRLGVTVTDVIKSPFGHEV